MLLSDLSFINDGNHERIDNLPNIDMFCKLGKSIMRARELVRLPFQGLHVDASLVIALRNLESRSEGECFLRSKEIFPRGAETELD
jgi:hypothetical protein